MDRLSNTPSYNAGYVTVISLISALGGYLFGFDFAVISGALPFLKGTFGLDEYWEGFATASLAIGCIIGCLMAGRISDRFGRRPGLLLAAFIFFVSSLCMALADGRNAFIAFRCLAGVGVGMASMLSPMYIAELSPPETRGRLVSLNQFTIVLGILVTNLVNFYLSDSGAAAWRWMFGLGAVPSLLFLVGVFFLPESPFWLLKQNRKTEAVKVLARIGNAAYTESIIKSMVASSPSERTSSYRNLFHKSFFPALLVGMVLALFQQFCGINVVFNFTTTIFEQIGFDQGSQLRQTVFVGLVNLVFTLLAMWQVDKLGRKPLMLFGAASLSILYITSAMLLKMQSSLAAWSLLAAIGVYAMTLAPVTWVLISEIFPSSIRSQAMMISIISLWIGYAVLVFTFPILARQMGVYTPFYIYAIICVLGWFFIKFKVKETKGRSLEDMGEVFSAH